MFLASQGDPVSAAIAANQKSAPHASLVTAMRRSSSATTFHVFCSDILAENRSLVLQGIRSSFQKGISDNMEKLIDDEHGATPEAKASHIDLVDRPAATQRRAAIVLPRARLNVFSFDVGL